MHLFSPLVVTGTFTQVAGVFLANGQAVTVTGVATVQGGVYLASTGPQTFTSGLTLAGGEFGASPGMQIVGNVMLTGGVLSGGGVVGDITASTGHLRPGVPTGILSTRNLFLQTGVTYSVELNGTTPGTGYDQLNVTGIVTLNDSTLVGALGFVPADNTAFTIIQNDGSDPVVGTFQGLREGAGLVLGTRPFTISYAGGDGNDVVLTARPSPQIAVGPNSGRGRPVQVFNFDGGLLYAIVPFGPRYNGPVSVALGDVNGDQTPDLIIGAGPGKKPEIRVFNGVTRQQMIGYLAFSGKNGVYVAAGDTNGDGRDEVIAGRGPGSQPLVRIFDGASGTLLRAFLAFETRFKGGVRVATGDVSGDRRADVIAGRGKRGAPDLNVFDGATGELLQSMQAYPATFKGGLFVASGDVNDDGFADIIVGQGAGGQGQVKVIDGQTGLEVRSFLPYGPFAGEVRVAVGLMNLDNNFDIVTGPGKGLAPEVRVFDGLTSQQIDQFFAYEVSFVSGIFGASS